MRVIQSKATHFAHIVDTCELSPAESRVAAYVIRGLTNKEIAATVGSSPVTVGVHLTRCYKKTKVRNRRELAWLMQQGYRPRRKKAKKKSRKKKKTTYRLCECGEQRLRAGWAFCPACGEEL